MESGTKKTYKPSGQWKVGVRTSVEGFLSKHDAWYAQQQASAKVKVERKPSGAVPAAPRQNKSAVLRRQGLERTPMTFTPPPKVKKHTRKQLIIVVIATAVLVTFAWLAADHFLIRPKAKQPESVVQQLFF